ncbi:unnamed protein product [Ilex paraguariensis]|uniref:Uncharacterized protein n=1 Tax=Ilex paraguariensis TaxID=185542 RepID=A0ABC8UAU7_9AQUA
MRGRAIVLILFFWAVLSIVTPTLIRLSAAAKPYSESNGDGGEGRMVRIEMKLLPRRALVATSQPQVAVPPPTPTPTPAPAPAPALQPDFGIRKL